MDRRSGSKQRAVNQIVKISKNVLFGVPSETFFEMAYIMVNTSGLSFFGVFYWVSESSC